VGLCVVPAAALGVETGALGEGAVPPQRDRRRLVHVVPDAGHALCRQALVERAPPCPCVGVGEVGEGRPAGPDGAPGLGPVLVAHEEAAGAPLGVDVVVGVLADGRVDDGDHPGPACGELAREGAEIGVALLVDGKDAVPAHVVDVEVHRAEREPLGGEAPSHLADVRLALVAPPALVVAERPARGQRGAPGERAVAAEQLGQRPGAHVVAEHAAAERQLGVGRAGHGHRRVVDGHGRVVGVLEEHEDVGPRLQTHEHRDGAVEGVGARAPGPAWVPVPQAVGGATQVDGRRLLAETRDPLAVPQHGAVRAHRPAAQRRQLRAHDLARGVEVGEPPVDRDAHAQGLGADLPTVGGVGSGQHLDRRRAGGVGPVSGPPEGLCGRAPADPHHLVGEEADLELGLGEDGHRADDRTRVTQRLDAAQPAGQAGGGGGPGKAALATSVHFTGHAVARDRTHRLRSEVHDLAQQQFELERRSTDGSPRGSHGRRG